MIDPPTVLADLLSAACDDLGFPLADNEVRQLAQHVCESLALVGLTWVQVLDGRVVEN